MALLKIAVKKWPHFDSSIPFYIKTVIHNAFWEIFIIFEKVAYRNIL